jgi:SAM-dependent methyltransferase
VQRTHIFGFEVTSRDTVVDLGSGEGADCLAAGRIGADVIAVDYSPALLSRLTEKMNGVPARSFRTVECDCNSSPLPLPNEIADVVFAKEVMEHLDSPPRFLEELFRIGKPGCRYFISVPDPTCEALLKIVAPPDFWQKPNHINVFQRDELDRLIGDAGLLVDQRIYAGFTWVIWWCLRLGIGGHSPVDQNATAPLLAQWRDLCDQLEQRPSGRELSAALDRLIPKSQIVWAHKAARPGQVPP